jgi:hypothetical protein
MARIIEFDIPTKDGIEQARGIPMWFAIGERKVKFVLQYDEDKARYLTHFASGHRCGSLDDAGVELMCKTSTYHRFTKKQLAQFLIDKMIARFGTEVLLEKLDSVPVINPTNSTRKGK